MNVRNWRASCKGGVSQWLRVSHDNCSSPADFDKLNLDEYNPLNIKDYNPLVAA